MKSWLDIFCRLFSIPGRRRGTSPSDVGRQLVIAENLLAAWEAELEAGNKAASKEAKRLRNQITILKRKVGSKHTAN